MNYANVKMYLYMGAKILPQSELGNMSFAMTDLLKPCLKIISTSLNGECLS
jgi:hypothetical protein